MKDIPKQVADKIRHLPETPGVYLWKDADGHLLYVGKAKRLKARVRSYFGPDAAKTPKTRRLVSAIADIETIVVPTERDALTLEATLIGRHRPPYNIALKDGPGYPYLKVTVHEAVPRLVVTRTVEADGAHYIGPYTEPGRLRTTLAAIREVFPIRSCAYDLPRTAPERPCLDYHIGRCPAPCVFVDVWQPYRMMIQEAIKFAEGDVVAVRDAMVQRMEAAAEKLDFERAAELRNRIDAIGRIQAQDTLVDASVADDPELGDGDVLGLARDEDEAVVVRMVIRDGRVIGRLHHILSGVNGEDDETILRAAVAAWASVPATADWKGRLILPVDNAEHVNPSEASEVPESVEMEEPASFAPSEQPEIVDIVDVPVNRPKRGRWIPALTLARQNARHLLDELRLIEGDAKERASDAAYDLQRELGLQQVPRTLACFDISTAQGKDTVGSVVWFAGGKPVSSEYRTMRLHATEESQLPDDFASMEELVERYVAQRLDAEVPLPDLFVIDGGLGQLRSARAALERAGCGDRTVISLAKRDEEIYTLGRKEPLKLSRRSPALKLLQQIRDEAHRKAVGYNRTRRKIRTLRTDLEDIPGIGPAKARALLRTFGSIDGVKAASLDSISRLPGFTPNLALRLQRALGIEESPDPVEHGGA